MRLFVSPLDRAFLRWEAGLSLPLTLATALMLQGYDVVSLEAQYKQ